MPKEYEKSPAEIHATKHIPIGWGVMPGEDVAPTLTSVVDLELVEFLVDGEDGVDGETMRKRGVEKQAVLGLSDAVFLLERQTEIPEEMRKLALVFAGTIMRVRDGVRRIAYLDWTGKQWFLSYDRLDLDFICYHRLTRKKVV